MITRRKFLGHSAAVFGAHMLSLLGVRNVLASPLAALASGSASSFTANDVTNYVKPMIGTGGHGHTYPGATVPFGMVQLSPDTGLANWDHSSGYHIKDTHILGFSHTHLSGTGCGDLLDFLVMPTMSEPSDNAYDNRSSFSHKDETAEPGYYSVLLKDDKIFAEMTATERVGLHRYTFDQSGKAFLFLDLNHNYDHREDSVLASQVQIIGNDTLIGGRQTDSWAPGRQIFFALKVSKPFKDIDVQVKGRSVSGSAHGSDSRVLKCAMRFEVAKNEALQVKVGLSSVSAEKALQNLEAETPDWNFDLARANARQQWSAHLSRIRIETDDVAKKQIFYTGLYHTMLSPTLFDDVDGQYRGMDGKIHQLARGENNYSTFSLWDTFRATHPLYTLMHPERVPNMVNTLIRMANESPAGVPIWPLQGIETDCMTGYHSSSVIAEAYVKGFKGLRLNEAYGPFRKRAMQDDIEGKGLKDYRELGYIRADKEIESVSKALEYCYDDWAVAHLAKAVGRMDDMMALAKRSLSYRNLFDPVTTFMRARLTGGAWATPFDPVEVGHIHNRRDYTESNAWQTTFGVLHDLRGLIARFGGNSPFVQKLDALFADNTPQPSDAPIDVAGLVGQYAHGNEPSHHIAYLYAYGDAAYKTQARVRSLMDTQYRNQADGLAGNEDCGQMSAWYIMSALGFYAVDPVSGNYVFGSPLFKKARVELSSKKTLTIETVRRNETDCYIQSIAFNGAVFDRSWFAHREIADGGHFIVTMGPQPNTQFGVGPGKRPPSATGA